MSRIDIDSQDLSFRVLCYLIELAESGEIDQLIAAGFSPETISTLRQMTVNDLSSLADTVGMVSLLLNVPRFASAISARTRRINDSQDLTYLARAGATALLLSEIFRISLTEAEAHLATLMTTDKRSGRPSMPDVGTRDAIHQWWAVNQSMPTRQRWIALHKKWPQFSLASLYAVINEFNM